MSELLFIKPVFKEAIWGGSRLREVYGYEIPSDHTGECWAISAHPAGEGVIANGAYQGKTLKSLWEEHPELFGAEGKGGAFPLLIKIIDAKADLSIQVHPDDAYAAAHENGSLGKMECWYILDCDPGATIVIGHNAKNHEELVQMVEEKRWSELIREVPIKKGDFFQINPGTVHAIKGGTLILETQQSSDITYRVYDYDRLQDGKPRPLHIKQSLDVIEAPYVENEDDRPQVVLANEHGTKTRLVTCPRYCVEKFEIRDVWEENFTGAFTNVSVLDGEGSVNGIPVKKGQHFIVPNGYGSCHFEGNLFLICSWPQE